MLKLNDHICKEIAHEVMRNWVCNDREYLNIINLIDEMGMHMESVIEKLTDPTIECIERYGDSWFADLVEDLKPYLIQELESVWKYHEFNDPDSYKAIKDNHAEIFEELSDD